MRTRKAYKNLLLATLLVLAGACRAQVSINVMVPNAGIYLKPQLWNLSATNIGAGTVDAQVRMQMKDKQTHDVVLSGVSARFSIPHGTKLLQDAGLQPIQYTYGTGPIDRSSAGMLPVGQYQLCYQLYVSAEGGMEPASDDCFQLQVEPLSPPLLTMPMDTATVETATPAFTWVPPTPLSMFGSLNYDFILSEVMPGQSATDAVQKNLPVQQASSLGQPFFQYPMQSQKLDTGKVYAWQVTAKDGPRFAARSEVWTFRLKWDTSKTILIANSFVKLSDKALAPAIVVDGKLRIEYEHTLADSIVKVMITAAGQNDGKAVVTFNLKVRYGQNFIEHDLGDNNILDERKVYELRLRDSKGNVRYMRFIPKYKH